MPHSRKPSAPPRSVLRSTPASGSAVGAAWKYKEPSAREFHQFATFVEDVVGISLNESKRALVARRLGSRMRQLGVNTLGAYADLVRHDASGDEMVEMLDRLATNETHFFREAAHWEFLERKVYPRWLADAAAGRRERRACAWSAACSTGQEPYSLAMQFLTHLPAELGWHTEIVATDISTVALRVAERAEWPIDKASEIPEPYLKRWMLRGVREQIGRMRASPDVRNAVRFTRMNLKDTPYPVTGNFDLILCRNVLIYFTAEGRAEVIERLTDRLVPGGLLFVGHAESLHQHRTRLKPVLPTVYERIR